MSVFVEKPLSLIEKKKLQWAKEKEELATLCAPWSSKDSQNHDRPFQRIRHVPKFAMANNNEFFRKDFSATGRRSSLPPLYKNQYISADKEICGGETSGYGSDNPNQNQENVPTNWIPSGYESSSSYKDDRAKWKEKTNKFWDTSENDPPNWVKRGLQRDEEIIVLNTSPAESPHHDEPEQDRPYTSCSSSLNRTFIRGQNIPVDSAELAERERRRQVALAHQEAIRQQLEEREKKRQEEKEKRIKEEQEEELRIEREQEIERKRKENELRLLREKQERERKRKEAIQEALEIAEKETKLEKMKQKLVKQNNVTEICNEPEAVTNKIIHNNIEKEENEKKLQNKNLDPQNALVLSPRQEILNNEVNNVDVPGKKLITTPRNTENRSITPNLSKVRQSNKSPCSFQILATPRTEMALVLQTPMETLQNMQYAVLMPNASNGNASSAVPIAIPLTIATDRSSNFTSRSENRILTPTQYRNRNKVLCDSSTQTENIDYNNRPDLAENNNNNQKYVREKLTNLELNYDNRNRKERRSRSDDRISLDEKPKWGANRPPTRYLKQSEKDPFYQRRKMRQKIREYKNSSDESQTGSPRTYRKKNYIEKRHTRALWRKNDHYFARNIRMYQTEIVPLESDKEQIYYRPGCQCCCRCNCNKHIETKTEILKIEHTSPRDRLPDCNENVENPSYILDKISSLHNGLVIKQEQWDRSPRTPSLSSSTRNTENN